jgi:hypothetical protein
MGPHNFNRTKIAGQKAVASCNRNSNSRQDHHVPGEKSTRSRLNHGRFLNVKLGSDSWNEWLF